MTKVSAELDSIGNFQKYLEITIRVTKQFPPFVFQDIRRGLLKKNVGEFRKSLKLLLLFLTFVDVCSSEIRPPRASNSAFASARGGNNNSGDPLNQDV